MTLFLLILHVIALATEPVKPSDNIWLVSGSSQLEISGATNVNTFQCYSVNYRGEDIMTEVTHREGHSTLHGEIVMKSTGFDCQNAMMTKDFAKTVKAVEFPEISIRFVGLTPETFSSQEKVLNGRVEITLAGSCSIYPVTCSVRSEGQDVKYLQGRRQFRFSDFGLEPPQKLFGAVQVKDAVWVEFNLKLIRS